MSKLLFKQDIKAWLDSMSIKSYTILDDATVDVDGNVDISNRKLELIPIQFNQISGHFNCSINHLKTLQGSPTSCEDFNCGHNSLKNLKYAPSEIYGSFDCSLNELTSLEDGPHTLWGGFNCASNQLQSFKGCPVRVEGHMDARYNPISSLRYIPQIIGDGIHLSPNSKLPELDRYLDDMGEIELSFDDLLEYKGHLKKIEMKHKLDKSMATKKENKKIKI